jgi:hypothetical protein
LITKIDVKTASPGPSGAVFVSGHPGQEVSPMSAANNTSPVQRQDDQADDSLDIPAFLKISAQRRKQAWREFDARRSSTPAPAPGREMRETERAYRASIERDRAAKRAADEIRFRQLRAKTAADKAARAAVQLAVKQRQHEERRGVGDNCHADAGTRARRGA